jgi:hypothetical protein
MTDDQVALLAEQIRHTLDLTRADINAMRAQLEHDREMSELRLNALEKQSQDHELRLRAATDGVTQFKFFSGLASGGSGLVSIIALIKTFFGGVA